MKKIPKWSVIVGLSILAIALVAVGTVVALHRGDDTPIPMPNGTIVSGHKVSSGISDSDCKACHGVKENEVSLDPMNISAHKRHLKSLYLTKPCGSCHAGTDVTLGSVTTNELGDVIYDNRLQSYEGGVLATSAATLSGTAGAGGNKFRKQVNPAVCADCHGYFDVTTEQDSAGANVYWHRKGVTVGAAGTSGADPIDTRDPRGCTKAAACHASNTGSTTRDPLQVHAGKQVNQNSSTTGYSCLKCHGGYVWYNVVEQTD